LLGVIAHTGKARDLRRDPRCALQSAIVAAEAGDPELKLYGRVEHSDREVGWWKGRAEAADVYALAVEEAVYIEWNLAAGSMCVRRWTAAGGETRAERVYP
jgi:hypothetical protein